MYRYVTRSTTLLRERRPSAQRAEGDRDRRTGVRRLSTRSGGLWGFLRGCKGGDSEPLPHPLKGLFFSEKEIFARAASPTSLYRYGKRSSTSARSASILLLLLLPQVPLARFDRRPETEQPQQKHHRKGADPCIGAVCQLAHSRHQRRAHKGRAFAADVV